MTWIFLNHLEFSQQGNEPPSRGLLKKKYNQSQGVPRGPKGSQVVPRGPKWSQVVPSGPKGPQVVPSGPKWSQAGPSGLMGSHGGSHGGSVELWGSTFCLFLFCSVFGLFPGCCPRLYGTPRALGPLVGPNSAGPLGPKLDRIYGTP